MTLPLIYALSKADKKTKKHIINSIKRESTNPAVVKEVINFVKDSGGLQYATDKMNAYKDEALALLETLPQNASNDSLRKLVSFVIERNK